LVRSSRRHQLRRPFRQTEAQQKLGLRDRSVKSQATLDAQPPELCEVDVGRKIRLTGPFENRRITMTADGLQRIAECGLGVAIIDEESGQRLRGPLRENCGYADEVGTHFQNVAFLSRLT